MDGSQLESQGAPAWISFSFRMNVSGSSVQLARPVEPDDDVDDELDDELDVEPASFGVTAVPLEPVEDAPPDDVLGGGRTTLSSAGSVGDEPWTSSPPPSTERAHAIAESAPEITVRAKRRRASIMGADSRPPEDPRKAESGA